MTECIERYILPPDRLHTSSILDITTDEVDHIDYRFEAARLESFKKYNWAYTTVKPEKLAEAGFFYTGEGDKVRCFECGVEICQWQKDDCPMVDHQRWSGRCRFVRNIPCGNVPIGVDPSTLPTAVPKGMDVCGSYGIVYMPYSGPDNDEFNVVENPPTLNSFNSSTSDNINSLRPPKHSEYASYNARLQTFRNWPKAMSQTKEELASAGFFYSGNGDQTLCYHCGGGLRDWEPEDDPWEQHAMWFDYCSYLLMVKGRDFVNKVVGRSNSYVEPENVAKPAATVEEHTSESKTQTQCAVGTSQNSTNIEEVNNESAGSSTSEKPSTKATCDISNDKDAWMCKICYNSKLRMLFIPCGHLMACAECARGMKICAICREPIKKSVRTFIS